MILLRLADWLKGKAFTASKEERESGYSHQPSTV